MSSQSLYGLSRGLSRLSLSSPNVCSSCRRTQLSLSNAGKPHNLLPRAQTRNATHAAAGVANGAKNRPGRRLGAKRGNGEYVTPNTIIFRQRGTEWHPGENVGKGRDHTIVAREPGYVRYYRDPARHPDRKYIGVVFHAEDQLPYPVNAARKRRLGLIAVRASGPATDAQESVVEEDGSVKASSGNLVGTQAAEESTTSEEPSGTPWPWESYSDIFTVTTRGGKTRALKQGRGGAYRMSNYEIGRAAEHAGVRVAPYKKDRFLAWRKSNARKVRNALAKSARTRKTKKAKK